MASSAYTLPLWYTGGAGTFYSPVPPAGMLWVVRNVSVQTPGNFPQDAGQVAITRDDGAPICGWASWQLIGGQWYYWEGRQVIVPPHSLKAFLEAPGCQVFVSGYQLTAP